MRTFWRDLRYAWRSLARGPGCTAAVLTLAAGAGAIGALAGLAPLVHARGLIVLTLTAMLLLAGCVNATCLLLERSLRRRREIAIRFALGASRTRLMRQLLTESLLVGALSGAPALILAIWAIALMVKLGAPEMPVLAAIRLDAGTAAGTLLFSLIGGVAVGLLPAWEVSRAPAPAVLGRERSRVTRPGRLRGRGFLATAEMALAAVLLACAGGEVARGQAWRLESLLLSGAALLAMAQAGLGLYGALSWSVTVRAPEFRIRLALGARAKDLYRLVLRQGLPPALAGMALGMAAGFVLAPQPAGTAVLASVPVLLVGVAVLACCAPARRAAHVELPAAP